MTPVRPDLEKKTQNTQSRGQLWGGMGGPTPTHRRLPNVVPTHPHIHPILQHPAGAQRESCCCGGGPGPGHGWHQAQNWARGHRRQPLPRPPCCRCSPTRILVVFCRKTECDQRNIFVEGRAVSGRRHLDVDDNLKYVVVFSSSFSVQK